MCAGANHKNQHPTRRHTPCPAPNMTEHGCWARLLSHVPCLRSCSSRLQQVRIDRETDKTRHVLESNLQACAQRDTELEVQMAEAQEQIQALMVNLQSDANPQILKHRVAVLTQEHALLAQSLEKNAQLRQQLRFEQETLRHRGILTVVVDALRASVACTRQYTNLTQIEQLAENVQQSREDTKEISEMLSYDSEEADTEDVWDTEDGWNTKDGWDTKGPQPVRGDQSEAVCQSDAADAYIQTCSVRKQVALVEGTC